MKDADFQKAVAEETELLARRVRERSDYPDPFSPETTAIFREIAEVRVAEGMREFRGVAGHYRERVGDMEVESWSGEEIGHGMELESEALIAHLGFLSKLALTYALLVAIVFGVTIADGGSAARAAVYLLGVLTGSVGVSVLWWLEHR